MQYVRIVVIGVGVVLLVLAGAVMCLAAVAAIVHASEDMRNWEYWNGIDDRKGRRE